MPAERYFIDGALDNTRIVLEGQEHHHLVHVMRAKLGDRIELINGKGTLAEGVVEELSKKTARVEIHSIHHEIPPLPKIILAQAIPRIHRLDTIVEKGTELGMQELWLFPGILSERKELTSHQMERLRNMAIAAIKQSGRLWLPHIRLMPFLSDWKESLPTGFYGDVTASAENYLSRILMKNPISTSAIFFTGPESGFDAREEEVLKKRGVCGVKLHDAILRTDTASLMALSLLMGFSHI